MHELVSPFSLPPFARVRLLSMIVADCRYKTLEWLCRRADKYAKEWNLAIREEAGWLYDCFTRQCSEACLTKALQRSGWLRRVFYHHHAFLRERCLYKQITPVFFIVDDLYRPFRDMQHAAVEVVGLPDDLAKMCLLFVV